MRVLPTPAPTPGIAVEGHEQIPLASWHVRAAEPGAPPEPLRSAFTAPAPGTVAGALSRQGLPPEEVDALDWWYQCDTRLVTAEEGVETVLRLDGLATRADVRLDGVTVARSESMFVPLGLALDGLPVSGAGVELVFRALAPILATRHPRPRWKTRIVREQSLRWHRTQLLGRCPGFAPGPPVVGPWRPVVLERRRLVAVDSCRLRPALLPDGRARLDVRLVLRPIGTSITSAEGDLAGLGFPLSLERDGGRLLVTGSVTGALDAWWPHTHGDPTLHPLCLRVHTSDGPVALDAGRVGFRSVAVADRDRFALSVNGVRVFCRGGALTPDALTVDQDVLRRDSLLALAIDAGLNMLRLPGLGPYADDGLLTRCDELGLLIWQDFPFANMDYPVADERFRALVAAEAAAFLEPAARHASLAVLCGGSEVEQQPAMQGIAATFPLLDEVLPHAVATADVDLPYVRSTPTGGDLPFHPGAGVAHYFGVGAYRLPLEDARRADVRFAAECLAFANVPDPATLSRLTADGSQPRPLGDVWKRGVPRDVGADWDFDDVRDHYLRVVYGVNPLELCSTDPARYAALSRVVTGEVIARTIGEWRREDSGCAGALVWWLNDVLPGAGWGVIDQIGRPKAAYWYLRQACRPVAVWTTDEGTNGLALHVANDRPVHLEARMTVVFARHDGGVVEKVGCDVGVPPHRTWSASVEGLLGRFIDASRTYRFGPPTFDAVFVDLCGSADVLARCVHLWPHESIGSADEDLGLSARAVQASDGSLTVTVTSSRLAYSVAVEAPGFATSDGQFTMPGGGSHTLRLTPTEAGADPSQVRFAPLNGRPATLDTVTV